ncbi:MAG: hypothetical protein GXO42_01160 [bacterium]|nr:hypothetical protein [bacterium]
MLIAYIAGIAALNVALIFLLSYLFYGPLYDALSSRLNIPDSLYMLLVSAVIGTVITLIDALVVIVWLLTAITSI